MPVNVKNIRRYKERPPELGGPNNEIPEPIIVNGHEAYEVEEIVAERHVRGRKPQVLVKWQGGDSVGIPCLTVTLVRHTKCTRLDCSKGTTTEHELKRKIKGGRAA
jgi:hypothetical protein